MQKHNIWVMIVVAILQLIFRLLCTAFILVIGLPVGWVLVLIYATVATIKIFAGAIIDFWKTGAIHFDETD